MEIIIVFILVLISFIWNVVKKNSIKLNMILCLIPIVLTSISIIFTYSNISNGTNAVMQYINIANSTVSLIMVLISMLWLIKDRKIIKSSKSFLLIVITLSYICTRVLLVPNINVALNLKYLLETYNKDITMGLLVMLQMNLFANLISNNKKVEKDKKEEK